MEMTYASENQNEARFAPLLEDAFEQLGIDVTLTPMLFNQQWERAKGDAAGRQDMFLLLYWPTYSDAGSDNLWSLFHSSEAPFFNLSYWADPEVRRAHRRRRHQDGDRPRGGPGGLQRGDEVPGRPGARGVLLRHRRMFALPNTTPGTSTT